MKRWTLRVVFDTRDESRLQDPWVDGEATAFMETLREMWAGSSDEEFTQDVTVTRGVIDPLDRGNRVFGDVVYASAELVDMLIEPVTWLIMNTIPRSVEIERGE